MLIAAAQVHPVILDRAAGLARVVESIDAAAARGCSLVAFGEAFVPGYPLWPCRTDGARFEADDQKDLYARYVREAVSIEDGDLDPVREAAARNGIAAALGIIERPAARGGYSLFCSAVLVDPSGEIRIVHRKLMPTYEERLTWGIGDGHGLRSVRIGDFTVGVLNCWENWMPLARAALHAAGVDLLVQLWPGAHRLTRDIPRFAACEGRQYVLAACAVIDEADLAADLPERERIAVPGERLYDGGSAIAGPDGSWIVEPVVGETGLVVAEIDIDLVRRERLSFDPAGHYARPDVLRLEVNRERPGSMGG